MALAFASCVPLHAGEKARSEASSPPSQATRVDLHVHLTMKDSLRAFQGEAEGAPLATSADQLLINQIPKDAFHRAGISLVFATLWPWFSLRPGRTALDEALASMDGLRRFVRHHPNFIIATSAADARRIMATGRVALIPHLEGAEGIRSPEDVDALFAAGYRSIGLVHFTDNALADAHDGQFGPLAGVLLNGADGALTDAGRQAVRRMFELGILVDVAHAGDRTRDEVLALAEAARVPIIDSHAGADWGRPYTLTDDHARRIAKLGGVVGIGLYRHDVLTPPAPEDRLTPHAFGTCDDLIALWRHFARIAGPQNVVLGSDLNSTIHRPRPGGRCPNGVRNADDLPEVFAALEREGLPTTGTAERVLAVLEAAAPQSP